MGHKRPTVYVEPRAYQLMSLWARLGGRKSREMTCFGRAELSGGYIHVTDAYMVAHEADASGVDADDDDVNLLMFELDKQGVPPDEAFRCWVHSHPGTGPKATYLSITDEQMIERFMLGEWLVSIVFDSVGANPYCRIDYKHPRGSVEADVEINYPYLSDAEVKLATETYNEKARDKAFVPAATSWKGKGGSVKLSTGSVHSKITGPYNGNEWDWDEDDSDWDYKFLKEDEGEMIIGSDEDVPEYELTTAEYANFSASMATHVDNLAAQVLYGEFDIFKALDELTAIGFTAAQAASELEDRLGSPVSAWVEDDRTDHVAPEDVDDQAELPITKVLQ